MSDPCQLFVDAVAASQADIANLTAQMNSLADQLEAAFELLDERLEALANCRDRNPGSGGGGEGRMIQDAKAKVKKYREYRK